MAAVSRVTGVRPVRQSAPLRAWRAAVRLGGAVLVCTMLAPGAATAHGAGRDAARERGTSGATAPSPQAVPLPGVDAATVARRVPARLPDLDATVTHEFRQLGGDGVLRITRYEERLVRRDGHLWTERVLPQGLPADDHGADGGRRGGHHHLDLARAARHLQRDGRQVRVEFVDPGRKLVVAVPEPEWDNVAFDGSWERAAMGITADELGRLRPVQRPVPEAGLEWLGLEARGRFTRVLWDPALGTVRRIESGSNDGLAQRTIVLTPAVRSASGALPWQRTTSFERKGYSDLLD